MEPLQKKIFGWSVVFLTIVGAACLLALTDRTLNTATTTNTVSFSGTGSVVAKPDIAIVSVTILTEGGTSKAAQDDNSRKSQAVVKFLEDEGVEERDIKTSGYNVNPRYTYPRGGTPRIDGYQVRQSIEVKIRDLDNADTILDGVVSAGANQVSGLNLTIDDPEGLQEEARAKAIADAKEKAKNLEKQLGISLGRIINFTEGHDGGIVQFRSLEADALDIGGAELAPKISIGENEIFSNVTITWQIK